MRDFFLTVIGAGHAALTWARQDLLRAQIVFVVLLFVIALIQFADDGDETRDARIVITGEALNIDELEATFAGFGYTMDKVRSEETTVPRLIISAVPKGLKDMRVIDRRKRVFFRSVLPLVLTVNEEIAADRTRLMDIASSVDPSSEAAITLSEEDAAWITDLSARYGIDQDEDDITLREVIDVLKVRVAPIPTSLAMAQAVEESAWGTSRFAREGNALFGQWVWNEDAGIVPEQQRPGQEYAVRAFESPLQSVRAYAKNLNTHWAYTQFRERRAQMLNEGAPLDGWALAETLTRYSERGEAYVSSLHAIMRVNRLRPLDKAQLASPSAMVQLADAQ